MPGVPGGRTPGSPPIPARRSGRLAGHESSHCGARRGAREQRHAAVELAVHWPFLRWLNMESVPILDELIVNGAWWDYVDRIAPAGLGHVLSAEPKPMGAMMRGWAGDKNIWRRRAALLCQLGFKEDTDLALLYDCVGDCMATGSSSCRRRWVGRFTDYWRGTDPGEVRRYVVANRSCLSRLTRREALKNLA